MKRRFAVLLAAVIFVSTFALSALAQDSETIIKQTDAPEAVQKTIKEKGKSGAIGEVQRVMEDGELRFDVKLMQGPVERWFSVDPKGALLSWQVFTNEVPPAVLKTIIGHVGQGKLGDIDKVEEDGEVTYDVDMTRPNGMERSFTVAQNGKLLSFEIGIREAPEPVRKTIREQLGRGDITYIEKNMEDDVVSFEVEGKKAGKKISLSISPDGKILDNEN